MYINSSRSFGSTWAYRSYRQTDANVIMVDWKGGAGNLLEYKRAARNTKIVGRKIAEFIRTNEIDPSLAYCIGHSLGAHCCGFVGKNIPNLGRITGFAKHDFTMYFQLIVFSLFLFKGSTRLVRHPRCHLFFIRPNSIAFFNLKGPHFISAPDSYRLIATDAM